jgi:hypothetical protein
LEKCLLVAQLVGQRGMLDAAAAFDFHFEQSIRAVPIVVPARVGQHRV